MDEQTNIIELVDENDNVIQFNHVMTLDYGDNEYVVLSPLENESGDDAEADDSSSIIEENVVILRVEYDEEGNDYYVNIEDETELDEVFSAVTEIYDINNSEIEDVEQ